MRPLGAASFIRCYPVNIPKLWETASVWFRLGNSISIASEFLEIDLSHAYS